MESKIPTRTHRWAWTRNGQRSRDIPKRNPERDTHRSPDFVRNTHRGGDWRQRPGGRETHTNEGSREKHTAGTLTDPQTSPRHTPSPSWPQSHQAPPKGGHWHSAGEDAGSPGRGAGRGLVQRAHSGTGERPARSAHKETARPAGAGSARPLRDS